jgi:hypothetical protein
MTDTILLRLNLDKDKDIYCYPIENIIKKFIKLINGDNNNAFLELIQNNFMNPALDDLISSFSH